MSSSTDSPEKRTQFSRLQRLLLIIDRWQWLGATLIIPILYWLYWHLPEVSKDQGTIDLHRALITNLIPVFLLFSLSWWLFRKVDEIRKEQQHEHAAEIISTNVRNAIEPLVAPRPLVYAKFYDVPWAELIRDAATLDIVVHYFDSWAKNQQDVLTHYFSHGGTVRIILPDPEDAALVETIAARFPENEQPNIRTKIENTPLRFAALRKSAKSGKLEVRLVTLPIWYCALKFSRSSAALSPFESRRDVGVNAPCVVMTGSEAESFTAWFDKEFDYLWSRGRTWRG